MTLILCTSISSLSPLSLYKVANKMSEQLKEKYLSKLSRFGVSIYLLTGSERMLSDGVKDILQTGSQLNPLHRLLILVTENNFWMHQ